MIFLFYSQALNFLLQNGMISITKTKIRVFDISTLKLVAYSNIIFPQFS